MQLKQPIVLLSLVALFLLEGSLGSAGFLPSALSWAFALNGWLDATQRQRFALPSLLWVARLQPNGKCMFFSNALMWPRIVCSNPQTATWVVMRRRNSFVSSTVSFRPFVSLSPVYRSRRNGTFSLCPPVSALLSERSPPSKG